MQTSSTRLLSASLNENKASRAGAHGAQENALKRCDVFWMGPCLAEGDGTPRARKQGCAMSTTSKAGAGGAGAGACCGALVVVVSVGGIVCPCAPTARSNRRG